jgi:hypothetical protein
MYDRGDAGTHSDGLGRGMPKALGGNRAQNRNTRNRKGRPVEFCQVLRRGHARRGAIMLGVPW